MSSEKKKKKLQRLIAKYQNGTATPEEIDFVEAYYQYFDTGNPAVPAVSETEKKEWEDRLFENLQARIHPSRRKRSAIAFLGPWLYTGVAAAVLLLVLAGGIYRSLQRRPSSPAGRSEAAAKNDVAPGSNKAILTLASGATIALDSAGSGNLARQGNINIIKRANGEIVYNATADAEEVLYNTMTTQKGGQYRLQLPDGTKVWLNSASSIHYPTAFTGKERRVDVTGEVYFEVAPVLDKNDREKIPFIVIVHQGMEVQVLGTHFNIMAYPDEPDIKTTLLEGSVKITDQHRQALLEPGQQAIVTDKEDKKADKADKAGKETLIRVEEVDTDKETAWISGFFQFDHTDLPTLMRQLQRWYDVEPVYAAAGDNRRKFGGRISRNLNLSEVLHMLEGNDIHFKIDGRKLMVLP